MDALRMEIIARDYNRMLEDLASIDTTIEFSSVVDASVMRVLAGALRRTLAAKASSIQRSHDQQTFTTLDGKLYRLSNYFHNDALWHRIEAKRNASLQRKLAARGLAKQSWLFLGIKVASSSRNAGIDSAIAAPGYVYEANHNGEQYPQDVSTASGGDGFRFTRTIVNRSPMGQGARMEQALYFTLQGEARYFEQLCSNRFYLTAASRAAKYPGIFTRSNPVSAGAGSSLN